MSTRVWLAFVALGVIVLHEPLGLGGVLAFALILLGSWLSTRGAVQHRAT